MSAATRAKTASERATIAADYIRRGQTHTRAFADCFEMGDGDQVNELLCQSQNPVVKQYADAMRARMCAFKERDSFEKRVADALGSGERGDNLVAVAADSHAAEMRLASIIKQQES